MKNRYGLYLMVFLTIAVSLFAGCNKPGVSMGEKNSAARTDIEPIAKRFPKLANKIAEVKWAASSATKDTALSPPGPSTYKLAGYILLTREGAAEIQQTFKWKEAESNLRPVFPWVENEAVGADWLKSEDFDEAVKSKLIGGHFYFNAQQKLLYFDLELE